MRHAKAHGFPLEIGKMLGEQCKDIALQLQERFKSIWSRTGVPIDKVFSHSSKFLPYADGFYNNHLVTLKGYAFATNIPFEEVFAWFCMNPAPKGCTDIVLSQRVTDGPVYLIHNEDYDLPEEEFAVLVELEPTNEPKFLAMTYGGIWFNAGVNEHGIGVGGNGLTQNDARVGIPCDFVFRKIFTARSLGEALNFSTPELRAASYCNVICNDAGEMYSMEASATDFAALHERNFLVHTNHYLAPSMIKYDAGMITKTDRSPGSLSNSIVRYNKAVNLIQDILDNRKITFEDIRPIMSNHDNFPWSICRHEDKTIPSYDRSKTCFHEIIDVTNRKIHVFKGNPCNEEKYVTYSLF